MATNIFTYGGFTFEPRGQFKDYGIKPDKDELRKICRALHYHNSGNVADGDEPFNYNLFYRAAGHCEDDVFLCKENGVLYVPCAEVLCIFDQTSSTDEIRKSYETRRRTHKAKVQFRKEQALRDATYLTEEQHAAFGQLMRAVKKCKKEGLDFVWDGFDMQVLRTDLLKDLTTDGNLTSNRTVIPDDCFHTFAENVWNADEVGILANPRT